MSLPDPAPGLVIRYSYLWAGEHASGRKEGVKDRPCAVVLVTARDAVGPIVTVLPITHTPPADLSHSIELPVATKRRLGLDDQRSWVLLNEANRFAWPGPDLRPRRQADMASIVYGALPYGLFETIRLSFITVLKARAAVTVTRTE